MHKLQQVQLHISGAALLSMPGIVLESMSPGMVLMFCSNVCQFRALQLIPCLLQATLEAKDLLTVSSQNVLGTDKWAIILTCMHQCLPACTEHLPLYV